MTNRFTQGDSLFHLLSLLIKAQTLEFDSDLQISVGENRENRAQKVQF